MTAAASRPLVFSMLLHGCVFGLALLLMMRAGREQVVVPEPFEIFPAPVQPSPGQGATQAAAPSVAVKLPAVVVPVPQPPARVVEETVNEPVRAVPARPSVRPTERTANRTTLREFQRTKPAIAQPSVASGPAVTSQPRRINMDEVLGDSGKESTKPAVATDPAQAADYWAMLQEKLRDAHEKPEGLDDGLVVRVEFVLRADGTLGDVRVIRSSGNAVFDASVLAAFRRVRGLGVPPAASVGLNQITFRTHAE